MISWFPSVYWFIVTVALAVISIVALDIWCCNKTTTREDIVTLCLVIAPFITLAIGFRAPNQVKVIDIDDEKIQAVVNKVVDKAVEARIKELSSKYKYELLTQDN